MMRSLDELTAVELRLRVNVDVFGAPDRIEEGSVDAS